MTPDKSAPRVAVPISTLAEEISTTPATVMEWIRAGLLPVFVPPGVSLDRERKRGPKGYKVFRDDWNTFLSRHTMIGGSKPTPEPKPAVVAPEVKRWSRRPRA